MSTLPREHIELCINDVRRHDHDRYLMALLAPSETQKDLFALLAFNLEVAKTAEVVSEPMLGQIRLQWWREAIEEAFFAGSPRRHAVLDTLTPAISRHDLTKEHFHSLIDAHEEDLDETPPENLADLERYAERSSSALIWLMLEMLDCRGDASREAGRHLGIAWGLVGLMRALPFHIGKRRPSLPLDVMEEAGLRLSDFRDRGQSDSLPQAVRLVAERADAHLAQARAFKEDVPTAALPAFMAGPLAAHYLKSLARAGYDPAMPRVHAADRLNAWRLAWAKLRKTY
jgi:phytoene synthase